MLDEKLFDPPDLRDLPALFVAFDAMLQNLTSEQLEAIQSAVGGHPWLHSTPNYHHGMEKIQGAIQRTLDARNSTAHLGQDMNERPSGES